MATHFDEVKRAWESSLRGKLIKKLESQGVARDVAKRAVKAARIQFGSVESDFGVVVEEGGEELSKVGEVTEALLKVASSAAAAAAPAPPPAPVSVPTPTLATPAPKGPSSPARANTRKRAPAETLEKAAKQLEAMDSGSLDALADAVSDAVSAFLAQKDDKDEAQLQLRAMLHAVVDAAIHDALQSSPQRKPSRSQAPSQPPKGPAGAGGRRKAPSPSI